jgi:hypothetical protein
MVICSFGQGGFVCGHGSIKERDCADDGEAIVTAALTPAVTQNP